MIDMNVVDTFESLYLAYTTLHGDHADHNLEDFIAFLDTGDGSVHRETRLQLGLHTLRVVRGQDKGVKAFTFPTDKSTTKVDVAKEVGLGLFEGYLDLVEKTGDYRPRRRPGQDFQSQLRYQRDLLDHASAEKQARKTLLSFLSNNLGDNPTINLRFTKERVWRCHTNTLEVNGIVGPTLTVLNNRILAAG